MNKLKALGTAAVISISALGGAMPATAHSVEWKFIGYSDKDMPVFYDIRHVARKGSFVAMPTKINGITDFFIVDCARGMFTASPDGDYFPPEQPIPSDSIADTLAGEVCLLTKF